MANISTYGLDGTIDGADKLIGTDGTEGVDNGKTKNFTISSLSAHVLATPSLTGLQEAVDDAAAAIAGVPVNGIYRSGSDLKIRVA